MRKIIGGAAFKLVQYCSTRNTRGVDIAITPRQAVILDSAKVLTGLGMYLLGVEGLQAEFEFLTVEEEFVPKSHGMTKSNPVWVASLPSIAAYAFQNRSEDRAICT